MQENYDLVIIGGGASGIIAAISARYQHKDMKIALLDRTFELGRKILVSGSGRCNITNSHLDSKNFLDYFYGDKEIIKNVFQIFGYKKIIKFFNDLGIELYEEKKNSSGKIFPISNQAKNVRHLLLEELKRSQIDIFLNTEVNKIRKNGELFEIFARNISLAKDICQKSRFVILSSGGQSYPALGSNGSGYKIASDLGHKIIQPVPSAVSLCSKNILSHQLQGVRMNAKVSSVINNQIVNESTDEILFTEYGFSGPAILNISREISIEINRNKKIGNSQIEIDFLPNNDQNFFRKHSSKHLDKTIGNLLLGLFPFKFPNAFLRYINVDSNRTVNSLNESEIQRNDKI